MKYNRVKHIPTIAAQYKIDIEQARQSYRTKLRQNQFNTINDSILAIQNTNNMTVNWAQFKLLKKRDKSNLGNITDNIDQLPQNYTQLLNSMSQYFQGISTYQHQQCSQQLQYTNRIHQCNIQHQQQSIV